MDLPTVTAEEVSQVDLPTVTAEVCAKWTCPLSQQECGRQRGPALRRKQSRSGPAHCHSRSAGDRVDLPTVTAGVRETDRSAGDVVVLWTPCGGLATCGTLGARYIVVLWTLGVTVGALNPLGTLRYFGHFEVLWHIAVLWALYGALALCGTQGTLRRFAVIWALCGTWTCCGTLTTSRCVTLRYENILGCNLR